MEYSEYKTLTPDEKEYHNFNLLNSVHKHVKKLNGSVAKNTSWRQKISGALFVMNIILWPLLYWLITQVILA